MLFSFQETKLTSLAEELCVAYSWLIAPDPFPESLPNTGRDSVLKVMSLKKKNRRSAKAVRTKAKKTLIRGTHNKEIHFCQPCLSILVPFWCFQSSLPHRPGSWLLLRSQPTITMSMKHRNNTETDHKTHMQTGQQWYPSLIASSWAFLAPSMQETTAYSPVWWTSCRECRGRWRSSQCNPHPVGCGGTSPGCMTGG